MKQDTELEKSPPLEKKEAGEHGRTIKKLQETVCWLISYLEDNIFLFFFAVGFCLLVILHISNVGHERSCFILMPINLQHFIDNYLCNGMSLKIGGEWVN